MENIKEEIVKDVDKVNNLAVNKATEDSIELKWNKDAYGAIR